MSQFVGGGPAELEQRADVTDADQPVRDRPSLPGGFRFAGGRASVEVKSAIPTEPVRLGTPEAADVIMGKLGKAVDQIDTTARLIADQDPALAAVPAGRPVLWLRDLYGLDIRCVRLTPYRVGDRLLLDVQQVIPLSEASELTIQLQRKATQERAVEGRRDPDCCVIGLLSPRASGLVLIRG